MICAIFLAQFRSGLRADAPMKALGTDFRQTDDGMEAGLRWAR
jgi:hypothetical protein